jgi:hypothetical protein
VFNHNNPQDIVGVRRLINRVLMQYSVYFPHPSTGEILLGSVGKGAFYYFVNNQIDRRNRLSAHNWAKYLVYITQLVEEQRSE